MGARRSSPVGCSDRYVAGWHGHTRQNERIAKRSGGDRLYCHSQLDRIVWCVDQILLGSEIPLGRLDRRVPEEQLDLFKFTPSRAAQLRASPAIMPHAA